jgi:thiamine biosynthesis lipoprotein
MNRRDFLHPGRLAHTAGQVLAALHDLPDAEPAAPRAAEVALLRVGRRAMATTFEVLLPYGIPHALAAVEAALDEVDRLEDQLTVFRDNSEVSRLNRRAARQPVEVEDGLFHLLALSARLSAETEGAFDITTGPLTKAWGFYRRQGRVPSEEVRAEALRRVGMRHVELRPEPPTVQFRRHGVEINLGSIGKGYALDRVSQLLCTEWNLPAALLHGGHSSVYAMGTEPGERRGWAVGIRHPWDPERRLAVVRLRDRALATSAATFQHLEHEGRKLGHVLDPRTGWPAEGLASATAVAATAAEADALSTAFFVLGVEKSRAYCANHPGVGAVLLPEGDNAGPVVIGLGPDEIRVGDAARESPEAP